MICTKCDTAGILNSANGKEFYFCPTCREEIALEPVKTITLPEKVGYGEFKFYVGGPAAATDDPIPVNKKVISKNYDDDYFEELMELMSDSSGDPFDGDIS